MGTEGNCCECSGTCIGVLDDEFDVELTFDIGATIHMINESGLPACPSWQGYICWSEPSFLHSSCSTVSSNPPHCIPRNCIPCGVAISDPTPRVWPGRPSYTAVAGGSHSASSIARWDKTRFSAALNIIPQGGTLYKIFLEIGYLHTFRLTFSYCINYYYAIATFAACPDYTSNSGDTLETTSSCTIGPSVGYSALTLPDHIDPFENDEVVVCASGISFPGVTFTPCDPFEPTETEVTITPVATCICCDYNGVGYWTEPTETITIASSGVWCCFSLLIACESEGVLSMTLRYESDLIECADLCLEPIKLTRLPLEGEAIPVEDIEASTLSRPPCYLDGCIIDQDRPLIGKPAAIYVSLPCAA